MTSQLAKELALGIKSEVEDIGAVFKKMAFLHPPGKRKVPQPKEQPEPAPVLQLPTAKEGPTAEEPLLYITYSMMTRQRKKAPAEPDENQLSLFGQLSA